MSNAVRVHATCRTRNVPRVCSGKRAGMHGRIASSRSGNPLYPATCNAPNVSRVGYSNASDTPAPPLTPARAVYTHCRPPPSMWGEQNSYPILSHAELALAFASYVGTLCNRLVLLAERPAPHRLGGTPQRRLVHGLRRVETPCQQVAIGVTRWQSSLTDWHQGCDKSQPRVFRWQSKCQRVSSRLRQPLDKVATPCQRVS